jgi:peptidyl-tRNA hydrolase, PTH1 family
MKLIVGLGNPGREYAHTRHNIGFRVLDVLAGRLGTDFNRSKFHADYATGELGPEGGRGESVPLLLVKPQTFMNRSGEPVLGFSSYFKIELRDVLVVSDDVVLPLGRLRLRSDGSDGGHNGLKDIIQWLGTREFARLRVGVGGREEDAQHVPGSLAAHVLSRFSGEEEKVLARQLPAAADACECWVRQGIAAAMNKFNVKGD